MRAIIAAGGTAGHINPAIAIAREIYASQPDSTVLFVGTQAGMESKMVREAGFDFYPMEVHSLGRSFSLAIILWNIKAFFCILKAQRTSRKLIKSFKPDVVIGCGSFVTGPIVRVAALMGVPTAIHEQNSFPGLANRLLSRRVDLIMVSMPRTVELLKHPEKTIVTGNPVRPEILAQDRAKARQELGIGSRVCILSLGGSLGAAPINEVLPSLMAWEQARGGFYHIHSTGSRDYADFTSRLKREGIVADASHGLDVREYISDMPKLLAAADLMINRAGATTIFEIAASGTASILIPCPDVTENHQYYNALMLSDVDAALLLEQKDLTAESLVAAVEKLTKDRGTLELMGVNAGNASVRDSHKLIYKAIASLVEKGHK